MKPGRKSRKAASKRKRSRARRPRRYRSSARLRDVRVKYRSQSFVEAAVERTKDLQSLLRFTETKQLTDLPDEILHNVNDFIPYEQKRGRYTFGPDGVLDGVHNIEKYDIQQRKKVSASIHDIVKELLGERFFDALSVNSEHKAYCTDYHRHHMFSETLRSGYGFGFYELPPFYTSICRPTPLTGNVHDFEGMVTIEEVEQETVIVSLENGTKFRVNNPLLTLEFVMDPDQRVGFLLSHRCMVVLKVEYEGAPTLAFGKNSGTVVWEIMHLQNDTIPEEDPLYGRFRIHSLSSRRA